MPQNSMYAPAGKDEGLHAGAASRTQSPRFENAYNTLAKIHFSANRSREGLAVLNRLLQHNATHPVALEMVRQFRPR